MAIKIEDFGEVAFGGAVTLTEWWDNRRIEEGRLASRDVFRKASFYTYLGVGLTATLMSVFGWWKKQESWTEKVSTGFLYDLPRFAYNLSKTLGSQGKSRGSESQAVIEAQRVMRNRQLGAGLPASRVYEPEFATVGAF